MEPVLEPLGFDWRMGVGIVAGVGAKELVVSTLGVMYAPEEPLAVDATAADSMSSPAVSMSIPEDSLSIPEDSLSAPADSVDGQPVSETESIGETRLQRALLRSVSPAAALAYMVFILLYFPCIATFVAIKKESGGWKWAIVTAVYTIALAWVAAFITSHVASLFL